MNKFSKQKLFWVMNSVSSNIHAHKSARSLEYWQESIIHTQICHTFCWISIWFVLLNLGSIWPKKNDSSRVKRKNDEMEEKRKKTQFLWPLLPNNNISSLPFPHYRLLTLSTLLHTNMVKLKFSSIFYMFSIGFIFFV